MNKAKQLLLEIPFEPLFQSVGVYVCPSVGLSVCYDFLRGWESNTTNSGIIVTITMYVIWGLN